MPEPIHMYHLTTTGTDDETLKSLFEQKVARQGSPWVDGSGQKNGVYVRSSHLSQARLAATSTADHDDDEWVQATKQGNALLVTVACDLNDEWELDYEDSWKVAKEIFFEFQEQLEAVRPGEITTHEGYAIQGIKAVEDDTRDGLEITFTQGDSSEQVTRYMPWDESMDLLDKSPLLGMRDAEEIRAFIEERESQINLKEADLLQALRDHLAETVGEPFREYEVKTIQDALARMKRKEADGVFHSSISLKYTGCEPLDIVKMEVLDKRGRWQEVSTPASDDDALSVNTDDHSLG